VICTVCGTQNRAGRRFCSSCGAALNVECPACGAVNEPGERFCGSCGTELLPAPGTVAASTDPAIGAVSASSTSAERTAAPGQRERKVATILFADLVGFTSLNEAHDPELVQALVARAFDRISVEAERYEGLIEKFAGDAMLALFGVPQSHEDDAERAVRAALEMQAAMTELATTLRAENRPELSLRIGIETGEVLVDQARAAGERDRMVTGDPVNTAARFQALAPAGGVLVGAGTYAATREVIEYEELEPLTLKGKAQATAAWRAIAVKARRGGRRAPLGIEAPLVGRDNEISLLKETVRRTVSERRPHLVTVVGAAGVGKSRLTWELEKYLDGLPDSFVWRKGRCLAYAQASFGALADLIRADAQIFEDDAPAAAIEKLDARLAALGAEFGDSARTILRGVLGLGDVPQVSRDELFDTWRAYLEALARVAPAVLVFEDIHWADEGLLDFIENMARWSEGPILLLCLARHELLERRPAWGGGVPNASSIVLEPLGRDENARLLEGLMPGGIPAALQARIVELADGNPLFTEELVRMFVDRGVIRWADGRWQLALAVDELEVPGSVQAVLAARLDALPAREKQLAQDAAVVGRVFWDAVLAFLAGERPTRVDELLRRLRVKELVVPREPSSLSGAAEFGFRHVLIRDVAYDSLPKRDRAAKHRFVAEWAERELADRGDETAELLASHYLSALRYEEEFSDGGETIELMRAQAYRYSRLASARAGRLYDRATATRWGRVALELALKLGIGPVEHAEVAMELLERGLGYWTLEEADVVAAAALVGLAGLETRAFDDLELESRIRGSWAMVLQGLGRADDAIRALQEHIDRLADGGPTPGRALLLARLGWVTWRSGSAADSIPILERALDEARAVGARNVEAWAVHELGVALSQTGRGGDGVILVRQSMDLARELGDSTLWLRCHTNIAAISMGLGTSLSEVEDLLQEALPVARRNSDRWIEGWLLLHLAEVNEFRARFDLARGYSIESLEISRLLGDRVQTAARRGALAYIDASLGNWPAVERLEAEGPITEDMEEEQDKVWTHIWTAWRLWTGDPGAAVAYLVREMPKVEIDRGPGCLLLARMAFRTGDVAALAVARDLVPAPVDNEGRLLGSIRASVNALAGDDPDKAETLASLARDLEATEHLMLAEPSWVDVALVLARAGRDASQAIARVEAINAIGGMVPMLGPLPETRWMAPAPAIAGDA